MNAQWKGVWFVAAGWCATIAVVYCCACGSTIVRAHELGVATRKAADGVCEPVLQQCIAERRNPCPALVTCQATRDKIYPALEQYQQALLAVQQAIDTLKRLGAEVKP
jgi:hypothetical protein